MGQRAELQDAGVVDEDVELAEAALGLFDHALPFVFAAHVVVEVDGVVAEVGRDLLAEIVEHIAEDDLGAFRDEQPHVLLTLAARAAGDDRYLAVQPAHGVPPSIEAKA